MDEKKVGRKKGKEGKTKGWMKKRLEGRITKKVGRKKGKEGKT